MSEIDTTILGQATAKFMDYLEEEYAKENYEVRLGEIVISAEIYYKIDDEEEAVDVAIGSSIDNRVHQSGILTWALDNVCERDGPEEIGEDDE